MHPSCVAAASSKVFWKRKVTEIKSTPPKFPSSLTDDGKSACKQSKQHIQKCKNKNQAISYPVFAMSSYKNIKFFWIFSRKYDKELLAVLKNGFLTIKLIRHLSRMGDI
jgi:hypothetical protein